MNQPLPLVPCPAIKQLLWHRLQAAQSLYVPETSILNNKRDYHISLYRAKDCRSVLYISAIALQLSAAENTPALEIATALTTFMCSSNLQPHASFSQEFTAQVVPPGLIYLEITQPYLAAWLQHLVQEGWGAGSREQGAGSREQGKIDNFSRLPACPSPSRLFAIQYAHARCCSLLRMAHREGLIQLKESVENSPLLPRSEIAPPLPPIPKGDPMLPPITNGNPDSPPAPCSLLPAPLLLKPDPIPWLDDYQLRCCHAGELALISQLVELLDDLYCPNSSHAIEHEKAAFNLSEAFQTFYSSSRIWGEAKQLMPHLAQARLGLVLATQSILRLLLQLLAVPAPFEL